MFCSERASQLCYRVTDGPSDGWRKNGFARMKAGESESHMSGEICYRNSSSAHVIHVVRYQAEILFSYCNPFAVGSVLGDTIRPGEHHTRANGKVRSTSVCDNAGSFVAQDQRCLRTREFAGENRKVQRGDSR